MEYEYRGFHGPYEELNELCYSEGWRMISSINGPGERNGTRAGHPTIVTGTLERQILREPTKTRKKGNIDGT